MENGLKRFGIDIFEYNNLFKEERGEIFMESLDTKRIISVGESLPIKLEGDTIYVVVKNKDVQAFSQKLFNYRNMALSAMPLIQTYAISNWICDESLWWRMDFNGVLGYLQRENNGVVEKRD